MSRPTKWLLLLCIVGFLLRTAIVIYNEAMFSTTYDPLYWKVTSGDVDYVKQYIKDGGDPNVCCWGSSSLLQIAKYHKQMGIVKVLEQAGAKDHN
jgi:hypothetical protein